MEHYKVLFVCLGNICRSPMAEGIFNHLVAEYGLSDRVLSDSCGTSNYHIGALPDKRARAETRAKGIVLDHKARQLCTNDFYEFDLILAMDESNHANILRAQPPGKIKAAVKKMRHYDPQPHDGDVPDPYYGAQDGFTEVFEMLHRSALNIIEEIKGNRSK